jgi:hypothetical protein
MEAKPDGQNAIKSGVNTGLDEWKYLCNAKPWERGIINKTLAQVIFFRGMFSICMLTVIFSVASMVEWPAKLNCWLPILFEHDRFCLVLGLIFCLVYYLCWHQNRQHFFEHLTRLMARQKKRRN